MLWLGKTPGTGRAGVLLLLIPCERQPTADERVASKENAKGRQRCVRVVAWLRCMESEGGWDRARASPAADASQRA